MDTSTINKIDLLAVALKKVDDFSFEFSSQIKNISDQHKLNGGHIEYAYVNHFYKEITGLSRLFHYLLKDEFNQKYVFFAVRGAFEVILYLEYVLRLAKEDSKKVLSLLSKDMAQIVASSDLASPVKDDNVSKTLKQVDAVNRILKTDFDISKIKSNTKVFPPVKELCEKSSLSLKDFKGSDMYHIYVLYSESNHLRLGSQHSITGDVGLLTCWALEYFLEIYIKFYQQLIDTKVFPDRFNDDLIAIKESIGMNW